MADFLVPAGGFLCIRQHPKGYCGSNRAETLLIPLFLFQDKRGGQRDVAAPVLRWVLQTPHTGAATTGPDRAQYPMASKSFAVKVRGPDGQRWSLLQLL